jgi:hypothetical protein
MPKPLCRTLDNPDGVCRHAAADQQIHISNESSVMPFSDKESIPEWAWSAIQTAVAKGIVYGYQDRTFRPQQMVSRTEMAAMVSKAMKWEAGSMESTSFSDAAHIPVWAKGYIEQPVRTGFWKDERAINLFW